MSKPVNCRCGGETMVYNDINEYTGVERWFCKCWECGIRTKPHVSADKAIEAWNEVMGVTDNNVGHKGEWIPADRQDVAYGLLMKCSVCGTEILINDAMEHNFCSHCGADMRDCKL